MTLLDTLISDLIYRHPMPWRIDYDWLVEVYDSNGGIVVKAASVAIARELIGHAERIKAEIDDAAMQIERILDESKV